MPTHEQQSRVAGGINLDDSLIAAPPGQRDSAFLLGDYRYALNGRIGSSREGNTGAFENIRGTLKITDIYTWNGSAYVSGGSMPAGTNKNVGFYHNKTAQNGIFFNWNSNDDHGVYRFELKEKIIYEVLIDSILNFQEFKIITQVAMFDSFLFFTDGINPQRFFDVNSIYKTKYNIEAEAGDEVISNFHINLIKSPPVSPPRIEISTTGATDYLEFKVYQACFRYVYKDNTRSVWSPRSNIATKGRQISGSHNRIIIKEFGKIYGVTSAEVTANDGLNAFKHDDIRAQEFISHLEVAVRESQYLPWRIIEAEDFSTMGEVIANYYNDVKGSVVASKEIAQLQDFIPLLSGAGASADNRIVLGDNTEDFPHYDMVITDPETYLIGSHATLKFASIIRSEFPVAADYDNIVFLNNGNTLSFKMGGIYQLGIEFGDDSGRKSLAYAPPELRFTSDPIFVNTVGSYFTALGFKIDVTTKPPAWATWMQVLRSECLNIEFFIKGVCNGLEFRKTNPSGDVGESVTDMAALSDLSIYDDIKALLFTEKTATAADAPFIYIDIRNWSNPSTKVGSNPRVDERGIVDIVVGATVPLSIDENPTNKMYYNFKEGDRVRFPADNGGGLVIFDEEILRIESTYLVVSRDDTITAVDALATPPFIEVYRPKDVPDDSVPLYECGEWYPILFPKTASRAWAKTDWTYTDNASIVATDYDGNIVYSKYPVRNGDIHLINKPMYFDHRTTFDVDDAANLIECMNPDPEETTSEWEHASGRPNIAYQNEARQREKETQAKFGGKYVEDSIRNNLNNFEEENQKIYPASYGKMMSLVETASAQIESVGTILLAIFQNETASIYVNRTTAEELSGHTQILLSDKVLGSFNALLGSHGTMNPESVTKDRGRVYFYDVNEGSWIRYGRDGLTPISHNKVRNFHKDVSDFIADYYHPSAIFDFDSIGESLGNRKYSLSVEHGDVTDKFPPGTEITTNGEYGRLNYDIDFTVEWNPGGEDDTVIYLDEKYGDVSAYFPNNQVWITLSGVTTKYNMNPTFPGAFNGTQTWFIVQRSWSGSSETGSALGILPVTETVLDQVVDLVGFIDGVTVISTTTAFNGNTLGTLQIKYATENPVVLGGFDKFNEELVTSFRHSELPALWGDIPDKYKVFGFSDAPGQKRWKCFYDYEDAEMFGVVNNVFLSFKAGELYIMEEGDNSSFGTFFGTKYDSKIEFVTNQYGSQNKNFQTINIISLDKWGVERFLGDIIENGGQSQQSYLELANFEDRENTFYSEILNDINSFGHVSQVEALINGDDMTGKTLRTLVKLDSAVNYLSTLEYIGIGFSVSRKNPIN